MRDRTEADDIVQGAFNRALLELILPPMRRVAKDLGYALTVHGSLNRDIDLVAIPWREHGVGSAERLVEALSGAVAAITGRCNQNRDWADKPHGRRAVILMAWCGESTASLDLSIMPAIKKEDD